MSIAIFHYNGDGTKIQCCKNEKMELICKRFFKKNSCRYI